MTVFGYIVYIMICLFTSVVSVAWFSWPNTSRVEQLSAVVIFGLVWYGAYRWSPFTLVAA